MATSLDKFENTVLIHHRHVKRFHTVKRLRISVQYIRRYSTKYAEPRRQQATQFRLESSPPKLLDQSSPNFYTNVVALVALLNLAHTRRYPMSFLNDRAISAGGRQFCPIFAQNRLQWQRSLRYRKKRSRSIIYTQKAFIRCKDCENRSSGS